MWLTTAHKSLQRIGQVRLLLTLASKSRAEEPSSLTRRYAAQLFRLVPADGNPHPWQQLALTQDGLPSCTGFENESSVDRALPFAVELGLIRGDTVTRTALGELFAATEAATDTDLYRPAVRFQYLMSAALDVADGAILPAALPLLPSGSFHYHASEMQGLAVRLLEQVPPPQGKAGPDRAEKLAAQMRDAVGGGGRRVTRETARRLFEDFWIPRLELATDVGILKKARCEGYSYEFVGRRGAASLVASRFELGAEPREVNADLRRAYRGVANALGFAPIRETVLLANATRAERSQPLVDVEAGVAWIRALAKDGSVRLVLDRDGRASSFKYLTEDPDG